jgi:hypothetical protein
MYLTETLDEGCVGILKPMFFEYRQFLLSKHEGFYYKESSHPNHTFFVWFFTPKFMSSTTIVTTITMNEVECIIPNYFFICYRLLTHGDFMSLPSKHTRSWTKL